MSAIKEFYGGTSLDKKDVEARLEKGKIELKYYKIISNPIGRKIQKQQYGIEVVKKCVHNNVISEEKKEIFNCFEKEEVADRVLELFKINKVSPINVVEVLQDMSCKKNALLIR